MLKYMCFLIIILVSSCSGFNKNLEDYDNNLINDNNGVKPIEVRMPFFWMVRPWKEGKLVTLDGWGRYAEISFTDARRAAVKPLVDFPRYKQDGWGFITFPEAGVITSMTGKMQHIAAIEDNKTKSHVPLLTWAHFDPDPVLLDPDEGLLAYQYRLGGHLGDRDTGVSLFIYNYKTDTMIYKTPDPFAPSPQEYAISMGNARDEQLFFSYQSSYYEKQWVPDTFFYDWKKGEITRNDLTEYLNQNNSYVSENRIHLDRRYLFVRDKEKERYLLKIDWDEEYSNIQITDMSYFFQEVYEKYRKRYSISDSNLIISSDGSWVTTTITDSSEYNPRDSANHYITTRVFFHIDDKYPNGISIPIFSDGEERSENTNHDNGAFVQHPVYGICYAQEWHTGRNNYLRLYRMDDVLTAINSGSPSLPFNHDDSKNYLFTRVYTYEKELIKGWIFVENDTDEETNQTIDSIIEYCEAEMHQMQKIELYENTNDLYQFRNKAARVFLYKHTANEDNNIYYLEINFYISNPEYADYFDQYKIIICNPYFNYSESEHDAQIHTFWNYYDLLKEGESAFMFFKNEIEKHRR